MKRTLLDVGVAILAGIVVSALLTVAVRANPPALEEGAEFYEGGICYQGDQWGISAIDGRCITPDDYDAIYPNPGSGLTRTEPPVPAEPEEPLTFVRHVELAVARWTPKAV